MNYLDVSWCVHWNPTNQIHWVNPPGWHPDSHEVLTRRIRQCMASGDLQRSMDGAIENAGFSWMLVENPMIWDDLGWFGVSLF